MTFSTAVIIERFQSYHLGHADLVQRALASARTVVIVIGSCRASRSTRNPFTASERRKLIIANLSDTDLARVKFAEVRDFFDDNERWAGEVRKQTLSLVDTPCALIGFEPDVIPYTKLFKEWTVIGLPRTNIPAARDIRASYLRDASAVQENNGLTRVTRQWLKEFSSTEFYVSLHEEQLAIDRYKDEWSKAPYPPVFVTTDGLVEQAGHVLLIQRNGYPGKNLWAIPGGFLDPGEPLSECATRELHEETQIDVDAQTLEQSLVGVKVFDYPFRSARGRTITHAHYFRLSGERLAKVQANDDAGDCKWVPVSELKSMEEVFFEDHFHILRAFLKLDA